jgi:hypothetical protein
MRTTTLGGEGGGVGGEEGVVAVQQGVVGLGRLVVEDVEAGAASLPA